MVAICVSMIVCCSSQVLPDHFEDIAHAKAFCDVEKAARSKGSMLQGVALDVPLAVLSQQRLHVVKYYVTVPELAAADGTQHSANATLLDAARARAAERFWPSPVSNDHPENLYPRGQKQSIRDIANNLWHAVKANPATYGDFEAQKAADRTTFGRRLLNMLARCCWELVPHARCAGFKQNGGDMSVKCSVFLEAAESICSKKPKHPQLNQSVATEIRDTLNYWIDQLPPSSSTFKFRAHIKALRDIAASYSQYQSPNTAMPRA